MACKAAERGAGAEIGGVVPKTWLRATLVRHAATVQHRDLDIKVEVGD
jgi:hypothetical protein